MRQTLRRVVLAGAVLTAVTPGPAAAKCCPLEYVVVSDFEGRDLRVEASDIEQRLEEWEMQLLSWPVLNGTGKGDERPPGPLGRGYLVTYVHDAGYDDAEVVVKERVYPFARPRPVAFTMPGQTQRWSAKDWSTRRVEPGWRPVEEGIVAALFTRGSDPEAAAGAPSWLLPVGALVAAAVALFLMSRHHSGGGKVGTPTPA
jgi:hypothetical protein